MASTIRDFLEIEKRPVADMSVEDLASECEGWRTVFGLLPRDTLEWMARLHDVIRFTKRNYQSSTGMLVEVKMAPVTFTIALQESAFDALDGKRYIEDKVLVIPANFVAYYECIGDRVEYSLEQEDSDLVAQSLE